MPGRSPGSRPGLQISMPLRGGCAETRTFPRVPHRPLSSGRCFTRGHRPPPRWGEERPLQSLPASGGFPIPGRRPPSAVLAVPSLLARRACLWPASLCVLCGLRGEGRSLLPLSLRTPHSALRTRNSCSRLTLRPRVSPGFRFPGLPASGGPARRSLGEGGFPVPRPARHSLRLRQGYAGRVGRRRVPAFFPRRTGVPRFPAPRFPLPVPRFWELCTTAYAHASM